jgi:SAM-dependent methyltransferase
MLEHVEDPIAAFEHQLRVLRPDGILYLTLPDARYSFDSPRQRTTVEHLLRDHHEGPEVSRSEHYEECAQLIEGHNGENLTKRVREMKTKRPTPALSRMGASHLPGFLAALDLPFSLELLQASAGELLAVMHRQ